MCKYDLLLHMKSQNRLSLKNESALVKRDLWPLKSTSLV